MQEFISVTADYRINLFTLPFHIAVTTAIFRALLFIFVVFVCF